MKNDSKIGNFWRSERSLSIFLTMLLAVIFLSPFFPSGDSGAKAFIDFLIILLLISGIFACHTTRIMTISNLVVVSLDILIRIVRMTQEYDRATHALSIVLNSVCILLFIRIILFQVFKEGDITTQRVVGAVSVYLLIGLMWANFYQLLYLYDPLALSFPGTPSPAVSDFDLLTMRQPLIYFSFTNLTTTGFGDILPKSNIARALSIAESLIGQLFPTILIGRLVSLLATRRPS